MTTLRNRLRPGPTTEKTDCTDQDVLIALPVFNEANHVEDVLRAVSHYASNLLVIDDGSTDGTALLLERGAPKRPISRSGSPRRACPRLITHDVNMGYGRSLIDAFSCAGGGGFTWVITMDCDHQHEPCCIPEFLREIRKNDADIISGSRYLRPTDLGTIPAPPERVAINRAVTGLLNRHLGLCLTDAFCGFKAYRVRALAKLTLTEAGYGLPLQLWVQASRAGLTIREIPVPLIYHDRKRNFAGILENPGRRMQYYLAIIERELGRDLCGEFEESLHLAEIGRHLGGS